MADQFVWKMSSQYGRSFSQKLVSCLQTEFVVIGFKIGNVKADRAVTGRRAIRKILTFIFFRLLEKIVHFRKSG